MDLRKIVQRWTEDYIVGPVSWRVNAFTFACSDKTIPELEERLKEIKEAVEASPEFLGYYLPGLIEKEESKGVKMMEKVKEMSPKTFRRFAELSLKNYRQRMEREEAETE